LDFEKCREAFEQYIGNYDLKNKDISLRYHHSYAVSELMAELAFRLNLSKEEIILAKVVGLLHDIGRFEQLTNYHLYSDTNSNDADCSCIYLFEQEHIRDMDKVDIYKQVAIHYKMIFDANEVSEKVLKQFKQSVLIDRKYIIKKSDSVIEMLAFIFDINFCAVSGSCKLYLIYCFIPTKSSFDSFEYSILYFSTNKPSFYILSNSSYTSFSEYFSPFSKELIPFSNSLYNIYLSVKSSYNSMLITTKSPAPFLVIYIGSFVS